jgi:hypothetical protein
LLFVGFFKGVVRPALVIIPLIAGLCWSLGFTTLTIGHLNIFTIIFGPMLIGLGIDYGLHFIGRYEEERARSKNARDALERTFTGAGGGMTTAALTTAAAFYTLLFTGFKGLSELGFIEELLRDLGEKWTILQENVRAEPLTIADLPPQLRRRYVGRTGQYRLFVFPSENIWEFQPLARFVADLQSVDPDALGTPVMHFAYLSTIIDGYKKAGLCAFVMVVILAFLAFRNERGQPAVPAARHGHRHR